MLKSKDLSFAILIAIGMSLPAGLTNMLLPSYQASSNSDVQVVRIPIVSAQVFILLFYIIFIGRHYTFSKRSLFPFLLLVFSTIVCGLFSFSPSGYYAHSLLWLLCPFVVTQHFRYNRSSNWNGLFTLSTISLVFLPIYCCDMLISYYAFGFGSEFSSYMFATNGHTFISFLLFLFLFMLRVQKNSSRLISAYYYACLIIYFLGGLVSQGRTALFACMLSIIIVNRPRLMRYFVFFFPCALLLFSIMDMSIFGSIFGDKLKTFWAMLDFDFEDRLIWGTMYSRFDFWDVFWKVFLYNPWAGAGGLALNILKFNFGFSYQVFIDPHNEFIYLLAGFGISGFLFIFSAIAFTITQLNNYKCVGDKVIKTKILSILVYMFVCSLTNANSAKQNIEILFVVSFCILLGQYFSGRDLLNKSRSYRGRN